VIENIIIDRALYGIVATQIRSGLYVHKVIASNIGNQKRKHNTKSPVGAGILGAGTSDSNRGTDFVVSKCNVTAPLAKDGIQCVFIDQFDWRDSKAVSNTTEVTPPSLGAFGVYDSSNGSLLNCTASLSENPFFSLRAVGLDLNNFVANKCVANGIEMVQTNNSNIRNSTTIKGVPTIFEQPTSNSSTEDIHTKKGPLEPLPGSGIGLLICNFITIENCIAQRFTIPNTSPGSGRNGMGISISACNGCTVRNCITQNNTVGIRDQLLIPIPNVPVGTPSKFYENVSHNNTLQNYSFEMFPGIPLANPLVVDSETVAVFTAVVPYINVQTPDLPTGPI
jgi:hypothetical protein